MRLVFCGTPQFAVPTLRQLMRAGHSIELVVTQPDRPVGRTRELTPPPVKVLAQEAGFPVVQPEKIKTNPEFASALESIRPDAIVVVAYGRILPKWMLDLPPLGNLNLHASLLPKYRGAAPIQWAIANGETVTGNTTMRIDEGLDTGDILLQQDVVIGENVTAEDMFPVLAEAGADLMVKTLEGLGSQGVSAIYPIPQDHSAASLAPILKREDALVDFSRSASEIYNRWRGFQPWPGAYAFFRSKKLTLHRLAPERNLRSPATPGSLAIEGDRLLVAAGNATWLELLELQMEGKKKLSAEEFLRGAGIRAEERLSN